VNHDIKTWTTYKMEDGSLVWGEYSFVTEVEFFEGVTEPTRVIKETWILQDTEVVVFEPEYWNEEDWSEED
jgi:hypothetical protein